MDGRFLPVWGGRRVAPQSLVDISVVWLRKEALPSALVLISVRRSQRCVAIVVGRYFDSKAPQGIEVVVLHLYQCEAVAEVRRRHNGAPQGSSLSSFVYSSMRPSQISTAFNVRHYFG